MPACLKCRYYTRATSVTRRFYALFALPCAGCIHAEILGTKPLFAGEDYISQLRLIIEVCM
jgi:hypothetical protein